MIERLYKKLQELGMTISELARSSGIPMTTVYETLKLHRDIRLDVAVGIAKALGISDVEFGKMAYESFGVPPPQSVAITRNAVFRSGAKVALDSPQIDDWVPIDPRWSSSIARSGWPTRRDGKTVLVPKSWVKELAGLLNVKVDILTKGS